ncbi:MAG: guanylate kinase [Rhizomicrobium sp.]
MDRRGLMLVLSSPSGAGKSTLARRLLASDANITLSVSATTRFPRPGEVNGKDYYFVNRPDFEHMVSENEFLEYATVFENRYGTPKAPVMDALSRGRDVLFDIDWQGTQQLSQKVPSDLVRVFILPPSKAELVKRLTGRNEPQDVLTARMAKANDEMSHWAEYDYVVVNDDLETAFAQIVSILNAERLKRVRQPGLHGFVAGLLQE